MNIQIQVLYKVEGKEHTEVCKLYDLKSVLKNLRLARREVVCITDRPV